MDRDNLRDLADSWMRAGEESRRRGENTSLRSVTKEAGNAAAGVYIGCAQALLNLLGDDDG